MVRLGIGLLLALTMRATPLLWLTMLHAGCAASVTEATQPPSGAAESVSASPEPASGRGPVEACRLGELSESVSLVTFRELLRDPEPYYGQRVRMRGYFILALENTVLLEPVRRQESVRVDFKNLPAKTAEQLLACRLKAVELQGYVTHVPHRGKERVFILADAMATARK